jgi:ribosomal protein S18 acetylase RimI-like enzyme
LAAQVSLRPARSSDQHFASRLYLQSTKGLLAPGRRWDRARQLKRFARGYKREYVQLIRYHGADVGWTQISESAESFHLHQIHLLVRVRGRGIGTFFITALQERARARGKPVSLNVMRGNRAIALYKRLGFRIVGKDDEKFRMRWRARPPGRTP